jgi:hypothetical protein
MVYLLLDDVADFPVCQIEAFAPYRPAGHEDATYSPPFWTEETTLRSSLDSERPRMIWERGGKFPPKRVSYRI